jgi:hypothetical protein
MAQELVLRSNSSFLRKGSTCVVTRRTLVRQHDGYARRPVIAWVAHGLEADERRVRSQLSLRTCRAKGATRPADLPGGGTAQHEEHVPEPAALVLAQHAVPTQRDWLDGID